VSWNGLLEFFLYWRWCVPPFCGLLLWFPGYMWHPCLIMQLKKSMLCSLHSVIKVNTLACRFILCSSISIFGTQHENNFWKWSLSDTILWWSDHEICVKWRKSDEMVNRLSSWIFSSAACTKPSSTTEGYQLHGSSCIFLHPTRKCLSHLHTNESLMTCSPYTFQRWWCMSASFMFLAIKKWITDHISHVAGFSIFLNIVNTQDGRVYVVRLSANGICAFPVDLQTLHACAPSWPQRCSSNTCKGNLFCGYAL
jgi:hypothetical protein